MEQSAYGADAARVQFRTRAVIAAGTLAVAIYGTQAWWSDGLTRDFGFTNEEWFGQDTYAGGADKLAHGYAGYVATRLFARGWNGRAMTPIGRCAWEPSRHWVS